MIRVFSGGRYTLNDWAGLAEIFREGLQDVCTKDCDSCNYFFACREVSQAVTYCDRKANELLSKKGGKNENW